MPRTLGVQSLRRVWLLRPHGLQYTRLPCTSPSPRVYSNSWPLSQRCHPTVSFSVTHFSSCPQSFPAWGRSWLFASGSQSIRASGSSSSQKLGIMLINRVMIPVPTVGKTGENAAFVIMSNYDLFLLGRIYATYGKNLWKSSIILNLAK